MAKAVPLALLAALVGAVLGFSSKPNPYTISTTCTSACHLDCDSGSCQNWYIDASIAVDCNAYSEQMGCGQCKKWPLSINLGSDIRIYS